MTVHRTRSLARSRAVGHLLVPESVVIRTAELLSEPGAWLPPHEALVWWLGRHADGDTLVLACHRPRCDSGPQHVWAHESATGAAARAARAHRLGIVAQVHSHPGADTRHSDGDDDLILMPYNGMFSLVVSNYGSGSLLPEHGAGLHQYQGGRWVLTETDAPAALVVVPAEVSHG